MPAILDKIEPGTLIYTKFVEGLVDDIQSYLEKKGFTVARHTGTAKEGLQQFLDKKVEVLIGSSTIGTGLDVKWLAKTGHKIGENKLCFTPINKKIEGKKWHVKDTAQNSKPRWL